jgi:hypothetical protein
MKMEGNELYSQELLLQKALVDVCSAPS